MLGGMTIRRLAALAAAVLLAAAPLAACSSSSSPDATPPATAGAAAIPATGRTVDAAAFQAAIGTGKTVLLDVRTPAEYAAGHLEGAKNIDVESPDFTTQIAGLDKSATYALYCRSGNRSGVAMATMSGAGFTNVFHLGGGITAWQGAGLPVSTS